MKSDVKKKNKLTDSMLSGNQFENKVYESLTEEINIQEDSIDSRGQRKTTLSVAEFKKIVKEVDVEEEQEVPFSEKSLFGKIMYILEFPFMIVAFITIPPVETEKLVSPFVVLYSITSPVAFIFLKGSKSPSF